MSTIYVTAFDKKRLEELIQVAREFGDNRDLGYLDKLEEELDRAEVVDPRDVPKDVITMNSKVRLTEMRSGKEMIYSLVFPCDADPGRGKLSVLAPIGTALLGYRVGDTIEWEVPAGLRKFKVEEILYQPEAAGDYHL